MNDIQQNGVERYSTIMPEICITESGQNDTSFWLFDTRSNAAIGDRLNGFQGACPNTRKNRSANSELVIDFAFFDSENEFYSARGKLSA
jgi:hypothetical protein